MSEIVSPPEGEKPSGYWLDHICSNCGLTLGRHTKYDSPCPGHKDYLAPRWNPSGVYQTYPEPVRFTKKIVPTSIERMIEAIIELDGVRFPSWYSVVQEARYLYPIGYDTLYDALLAIYRSMTEGETNDCE